MPLNFPSRPAGGPFNFGGAEPALSLEALEVWVNRGIDEPLLLGTDAYRRRFARLVKQALADSARPRSAVLDVVEACLDTAPSTVAPTLRDLLAQCLHPFAVFGGLEIYFPLLSRLSGALTPLEGARILLSELKAQTGPELAARMYLALPHLQMIAQVEPEREGSVVASPFVLCWNEGTQELGRLEVSGLANKEKERLESLAPWLQPTLKRWINYAHKEEAHTTGKREGRAWQLRAELAELMRSPLSEAAYRHQALNTLLKLFDAEQVVFWGGAGEALEIRDRAKNTQFASELTLSAGCLGSVILERCVKTVTAFDETGKPRLALLGPVWDEDHLEGVLQMTLNGTFLSPALEDELAVACNFVAAGLKTARFYEQLSFHASHDPLTQLANRRTFEQYLERECKLAERHGNPLSLMMVDVDHFKGYNDTYGHPAGDALLRALAGALSDAVRTTDFVARYGGEEFVIVLPHTHEAGARAVADKVLLAVRELHFHTELESSVTASMGIATAQGLWSPTALLCAADKAMYQAKHQGRDRVISAPSPHA